MVHIYYFLAFIMFTYELTCVINIKQWVADVKRYDELKEDKQEQTKEFKELLAKHGTPAIFIIIWVFIGFFTFQYMWCILYLAIIIPPMLFVKRYKYKRVYIITHWILSLIGLLFAIFIVVNKYHLHLTF